jgi:hypothetical protein
VWPTWLENNNWDIGHIEVSHGKIGSIHQGIKYIDVVEESVCINGFLVGGQGTEESIVKRDYTIGLHVIIVGVDIEEERWGGGLEEAQKRWEYWIERAVKKGLGWWKWVEDDGWWVRSWHLAKKKRRNSRLRE